MTAPHDQDLDPDAHDCDEDLSVWEEHDDEPKSTSEEGSDHPLSEPLAIVADVCEDLQTWASDLAHALRRRGGGPTDLEVEEGKELARRAQEAVVVVGYLSRHM
jgi:hypothetical protein